MSMLGNGFVNTLVARQWPRICQVSVPTKVHVIIEDRLEAFFLCGPGRGEITRTRGQSREVRRV
jgi:hypothetical protein